MVGIVTKNMAFHFFVLPQNTSQYTLAIQKNEYGYAMIIPVFH